MRDWLHERATVTPDDLAVIDADTDTRWSYSGLDAAVEETAGRLVALGVAPGDQVGMLMSTQLLSVCLLHAAQRLGLCLVPLNDRLTTAEHTEQIEAVDLSLLVCGSQTEHAAVSATESVPVVSVDKPETERVTSFRDVDPAPIQPARWEFDDPQLLVFTSGSTGEPKAVVLTMGNLLASAAASGFRLGVDPDDRWLLTLAMYHVGGIAPIFRSTLYGTAIVLRSSFDPGTAADDIDRFDVTVVSLVPTMLATMLDRRGTLADSLRVVLLGGAPAPESLIQRCQNYSIPVFPTYGMTETASQIATARPREAFEQPGTVGRPLLWTEITVVDDEGIPVETGEPGEIIVSGPTVTAGYYNNVEANVEAFCEQGLKTGDIGRQTEDGSVFVHNRIDDRIITGGENVDPGEVASVLQNHPEIESAAVVGIPDDTWGQQVAALVVPRIEALSLATVESHCRERLAGYKLPRTIAFADDIPRTASGSINRNAVAAQLRAVADDTPPETSNGADGANVDDTADTADTTDAATAADTADTTNAATGADTAETNGKQSDRSDQSETEPDLSGSQRPPADSSYTTQPDE